MYVLISWSTKNGVALGREELEVRSTSKLTIMNGGRMEPGATKLSQNHVLIILSWMLLKEKKMIFSLRVLFCFVVKIMVFIL